MRNITKLTKVFDDIEMQWSLFQTAKILSAVESCEQKRLKMLVGVEKRTFWWNQTFKNLSNQKNMLQSFVAVI